MTFHPRNRHQGHYDFAKLLRGSPGLARFVTRNPHGDSTIDFADPVAVRALNGALLRSHYGIQDWDIPKDYLCPPIPGRADYIHHVADLLGELHEGPVPRGPSIRVLDVGVGANCIYPLIGHGEYGWSFVGTDVDPIALTAAKKILDANPEAASAVELRRQPDPGRIFHGILGKDERFDLTISNPPFHSSLEEARAGSRRKWRNLGVDTGSSPLRNFGGQSMELVYEGGELGFIERLIRESAQAAEQCACFTTLVSRDSHLPRIYELLERAEASDAITIDMAQGQKKSRIVAWTFE